MRHLTLSPRQMLLASLAAGSILFLVVVLALGASDRTPESKYTRTLNLNDKLVVKSLSCVQKVKSQTDAKLVIVCSGTQTSSSAAQAPEPTSSIQLAAGDKLTVKANGCRLVLNSSVAAKTLVKCAALAGATATFTPTPTETGAATATDTTTAASTATRTVTATPTATGTFDWLGYVNTYRDQANLPHVNANPTWSYGDWLHSRYMVKNDVIAHDEGTATPWYSDDGKAAAQNSDLIVTGSTTMSDQYAIDGWMTAPFHALGIIDPGLATVGYNSYHEFGGSYASGAGLDVLRGLGSVPGSVTYPVEWPSDGKTVKFTSYTGNEYPNPLSSCSGYSVPSGLPIILQLGHGSVTPNVTAHSFKQATTDLDHCVYDETDYTNGSPSDQALVRSILGARSAIVLIPRTPLVAGKTYTVSITTNGNMYTWNFSVASNATAPHFDLGTGSH